MKTYLFTAASISLLLAATLSFADTIYQTVGPDGTVIFTDQPTKGAKEIKIKPLTTFNPEEAGLKKESKNTAASEPEEEEGTKYKLFTIVSPANDSTLQTGEAGNTTVQVQLDPTLRVKAGHRLTALVDGSQLDYVTSSNRITLNNLDRGTHSIKAVIVNQRGDIVQLSSNSVTLHVKRGTVFAPANPNNPNNGPIISQ